MSRGLSRVPNWDAELEAWANAKRREPWAWGETDCGNLTRQALRVVYGCSVVQTWRPLYNSRTEAIRWLRELGKPLSQYFLDYGATVVPIAGLQGGDIVQFTQQWRVPIHLRGMPSVIPSLAVAVDGECLLTSEPDRGPYWLGVADIDFDSTAYRF